ncbi:MAG: UDP-glucose 4-epimerase GalE [Propionibacteriaceae bacterium]|jgi:UDP-glucose-4-epimerase GalE|nr:UDP-glucose 4-epimerase GalE [Propionibacteriaceae bacterium]
MRVLVTGGAGYIGSQTAKALASDGIEPVVLDNLTTGHPWAVRWGPFVSGDVGDLDLLRRILCEYRVEGVIHCAASAYVGESVLEPRKYFHNNVANTLVLLDAMLEAGVGQIVFSSTCATYGIPDDLPIDENHPQRPVNPYGDSKHFVERVLRAYGDAYGLGWVALRYFNAAGADPDGELGEEHESESHLIPLVIEAALSERQHVDVFGTDYPTADGTAVRDYIHVADLADAHVRALSYLRHGGSGLALNLGTGRGYSVREVVATVERVGGRPVPVREAPRRPGDPPALVADPTRAAQVLNWRPQHANLESIVRSAWAWRVSRFRQQRRATDEALMLAATGD